ncbi:MAG: tol-pal system protein [Alphaproteobacteria bacterium]|nr:MAG: tol-pal system protein [Alphaproteobacteria bacterium]
MRGVLTALVTSLFLSHGAAAQGLPPEATLEDIRLYLKEIDTQLETLRAQLLATGVRAPTPQGSAQTRFDRLKAEIEDLTARVERLEGWIRNIAEDGGRRYADVEFRLSELEGNPASTEIKPVPLGGEEPATPPEGGEKPVTALSEQGDFDAAQALLKDGKTQEAEAAFRRFVADNPGSPLLPAATLGLAEAQMALGRTREAAKNYLGAFNLAPQGAEAPQALFGVGRALRLLGQLSEACLTFDELERRFPELAPDLAASVVEERRSAGCS